MNAKSSISSAIEIAHRPFKARTSNRPTLSVRVHALTAAGEPAPGNRRRLSADGRATGPSVRRGIAQRLGDEGRRDQVVGVEA